MNSNIGIINIYTLLNIVPIYSKTISSNSLVFCTTEEVCVYYAYIDTNFCLSNENSSFLL